jgi:hypothetical protein
MYFQTMKDNCSPVYDETFEYILSQGELNSRQLEVSVVTRKGWFSSGSPVMGQVCVISPFSFIYDYYCEVVEF